jgi:hypothetical protein
MTISLDVQDDFAAVTDRLEAATLVRRGGGSTPVASALRRVVTTREAAASNGKYTAADVRWHLAASELDEPPRIGDRIVDGDGESWTILEIRRATCGSRFECTSRNLAIAAGLDTLITVRRELVVKGSSGAAERMWEVYRIGVRAKIQEQSATRSEEHGRQSGVVTAKVYLAEQITVDGGFQIVAADGTTYEVTGCESMDEIGGLFVINAERRL